MKVLSAFIFLLLSHVHVTRSLHWTSAHEYANHARLKVCQGQDLDLLWSYETDGNGDVVNLEWTKYTPVVNSAEGFHAQMQSMTQVDDVTWHVRLSCGTFSSLGTPPADVMWTTPDNRTINSTGHQNGVFYLDLDTTRPGGQYTCFLTSHCVGSDSPLSRGATVEVDDEKLQMALLYNQIANLTSAVTSLQQQNAALTQQLDNVTEALQQQTTPQQLPGMEDFVHLPQDCRDVQHYSSGAAGQHTLFTRGITYHAYCDQGMDGGGWTVIQRRQDGHEDFYRGWSDYLNGFGDVTADHWIGLEKLYLLTTTRSYRLRVVVEDFAGGTATADYSTFHVDSALDNFALHVSGYSGDAGEGLSLNNGLPFTTRDNDNDLDLTGNCALSRQGAFWYGDCSNVNPNGRYVSDRVAAAAAGDEAVYCTRGRTALAVYGPSPC